MLNNFLSRTHSQEIVAVSNRIKNLLSRVVALEESFDSRPSDVADQRHRDELIQFVTVHPLRSLLISPRNLHNIEERLRFLSEKLGSSRLVDHVKDDEDVLRNLEDLQEAILDYQVHSQPQTQCSPKH